MSQHPGGKGRGAGRGRTKRARPLPPPVHSLQSPLSTPWPAASASHLASSRFPQRLCAARLAPYTRSYRLFDVVATLEQHGGLGRRGAPPAPRYGAHCAHKPLQRAATKPSRRQARRLGTSGVTASGSGGAAWPPPFGWRSRSASARSLPCRTQPPPARGGHGERRHQPLSGPGRGPHRCWRVAVADPAVRVRGGARRAMAPSCLLVARWALGDYRDVLVESSRSTAPCGGVPMQACIHRCIRRSR